MQHRLSPSPDRIPSPLASASSTSLAPTSPRAPEAHAFNRSNSISHANRSSNNPGYVAVGIEDSFDDKRGGGRSTGARLPTFWRRGGLTNRPKGGKLRWVVLGFVLFTGSWLFFGGAGSGAGSSGTPRTPDPVAAPRPTTPPPNRKPAAVNLPVKDAAPPRRPMPPASQKLSSASAQAVDVDVFPSSRTPSSPPQTDEKFLAYSPHSGYHNQRISLENALTLAYMTGRTLLLPPIWLGHAIPYISFDKLQRRLQMASKDGLDRCKIAGEGGNEDPIPRECEGYYDWTLIHWEFLVNIEAAKEKVPIRNRWNLTDEWMQTELGLTPPTKKGKEADVFHLKDDTLYQYKFYDSKEDDEPLNKFANRINVPQLAEDSKDYKLLHVGSLFGTSRMRTVLNENYDARTAFRHSMVFQNTLLDHITEQIRERLGGAGKYYGIHLRVGDGVFQEKAKENTEGIWTMLCVTKMKMPEDLCEDLAHASSVGKVAKGKRSADDTTRSTPLEKRANSRPQREGAYHHAPLPPLPLIKTRSSSPLASSLSCRGVLHTDSHLLPFNAPLFIATDSKLPTTSPHLAVFFHAFPCTFLLNDFSSVSSVNGEPVEALNELAFLRNKDDKVPLAQFLYPQLDAQIASWGRGFVGTPLSTYSRFAADVLHQVYHGWDIIERG